MFLSVLPIRLGVCKLCHFEVCGATPGQQGVMLLTGGDSKNINNSSGFFKFQAMGKISFTFVLS